MSRTRALEFAIAWRYLRSRRGSRLLSFISVIAVAGVVVGVSALVIIMGVMNGLQTDLREKILVGSPDVRVLITPASTPSRNAARMSCAALRICPWSAWYSAASRSARYQRVGVTGTGCSCPPMASRIVSTARLPKFGTSRGAGWYAETPSNARRWSGRPTSSRWGEAG